MRLSEQSCPRAETPTSQKAETHTAPKAETATAKPAEPTKEPIKEPAKAVASKEPSAPSKAPPKAEEKQPAPKSRLQRRLPKRRRPPRQRTPERLRQPNAFKFRTIRVEDPQLVDQLEAAHVELTGVRPSLLSTLLWAWILPIIFFAGIYYFLTRRMGMAGQAVMSIGKSKAKLVADRDTGVGFGDVAGCDEAKYELQEVVDFLKNPQRYQCAGRQDSQGHSPRRTAGDRQNAAVPSGCRGSACAILLDERQRVRGDVRRRGGGAGP